MWCQSPLELCWPDKICWEILATPVDLIAGCFSSSKLALEVFFCVVFSRFTSQLSLVIGFSSPTSAIHVLSGLTNHQAMHETTQHSWNCSTFCHATMKFPWHKAVPPSLASTNQQDGLSFPHHQWQDSMGPRDSRSSCCSTCVNSLSWLLSSLSKLMYFEHVAKKIFFYTSIPKYSNHPTSWASRREWPSKPQGSPQRTGWWDSPHPHTSDSAVGSSYRTSRFLLERLLGIYIVFESSTVFNCFEGVALKPSTLFSGNSRYMELKRTSA